MRIDDFGENAYGESGESFRVGNLTCGNSELLKYRVLVYHVNLGVLICWPLTFQIQ